MQIPLLKIHGSYMMMLWPLTVMYVHESIYVWFSYAGSHYSDCCMGMYTLWLCIDVYADSISDLHLLHTHNYM